MDPNPDLKGISDSTFVTVEPDMALEHVVLVTPRASIGVELLIADGRMNIFVGKPLQGCFGAVGSSSIAIPYNQFSRKEPNDKHQGD